MDLLKLSEQLGKLLQEKNYFLTTAESCTGGMLSQYITAISGSSKWFDRGFVTYSNEAKEELLSVPKDIIDKFGAVSEQTAVAMVEGALKHSRAQCSISITGIAGPEGGTFEKPVGTVWIGWSIANQSTRTKEYHFIGSRDQIRNQAVCKALKCACDIILSRESL